MRGCLLDEAEFTAEKSVVLEELAMGEDDPWSSLFKAAESTMFQIHPYHHPVIGYREDLERVSAAGMRSYYERNYGPDRAFFVIVGDIEVAATETRIRELFESIPATGSTRDPVLAEPAPVGERRATIRCPGETSRMVVSVRTCRMGEPDDFVLDVLSIGLAGGKSSRLYQRMVQEQHLVTDVSTYNEPRLDPGAFWFTFELADEVEFAAVEACLAEELQRVLEHGLDEDEIRRARTQLEAAFLFEDETALDSALKLGRWEAQCVGGYHRLGDVDELYAAVDAEAIKTAVGKYFATATWNVVHSLPTAEVVEHE